MQHSQALTVVQFTDTHFFGTPKGRLLGVDTAQSFAEVSKLAHGRHGTPDFYLLTGDLSQDETPDSYARFAGAIEHFKAPAYFLPGNHDARPAMEKAFAAAGAPIQSDRDFVKGAWQFILLDTQVPKQIGGSLAQSELERLERCLSAHPGKHTVIAMHHNPVPVGAAWIDRYQVDNGAEFLEIIDRHRQVRAVIWGHVHQEFQCERNGVQMMASPSTCVQFKPLSQKFAVDNVAPGYRILTFHADGRIESVVERGERVADGLDLASAGY
jgi:Icc protein